MGNVKLNSTITCVSIIKSMRIHIMKTSLILIVAVAVIFTFALVTGPISAHNSMDVTDNCCNSDCSNVYVRSSIPLCCSIAEGSFIDCSIADFLNDEAILPDQSALKWDVCDSQCIEGVFTKTDSNPEQIPKKEFQKISLLPLSSEYHCRNNLDSEDPYLS